MEKSIEKAWKDAGLGNQACEHLEFVRLKFGNIFQAVMASGFALAQFRFLERLLVVHGRWRYTRLAQMVFSLFIHKSACRFVPLKCLNCISSRFW